MDQTLFEILRSGVGDVRTAAGGRAGPPVGSGSVAPAAAGPGGSASFVGLLSSSAHQSKPQEPLVSWAILKIRRRVGEGAGGSHGVS